MKTTDFINHLQQVYEGDPWYGASISDILTQQFVDPNFSINGGNSIGQIIEHMLAWRAFTIEKLKENKDFDITPETDWHKGKTYTNEEFSMLADKFKDSHKKLIKLIAQHDNDEWLQQKVPGRGYTFEYLMEGIIEHDIYHLGQVSLLRSGSGRQK